MKYDKLKYNILGKNGDVVFFLHGYGGSLKSLLKLAESVKSNHKCYLFDLYGFGQTQFPEKILDIYDYALGIYLFCVERGIRRLSIVSHSFGSRIALILSAVTDLQIDKLVIIDGAGLKPSYNLKYYLNVFKYKIHKSLHTNQNVNKDNKYGSDEYKTLSPDMQRSYVKVVNQHLGYLLEKVKSQTLLLWGNNDKDTPIKMCKKLNKNIKNSICKIYNGGHFMYVKKHSYVKNDLRKFLGDAI